MGAIRPPHMKVICPTAKTMPVTLNSGFQMPSWFDLKSLEIHGDEDEEGIKRATANVHAMIQSEIQDGIPSNRIILGGFSQGELHTAFSTKVNFKSLVSVQGGALALYAGLTFVQPLAGIMALSCWLPLGRSFPAARKTPDTVPIIQCHGDCDPLVKYSYGQMSSSVLKGFMKNTQFTTYRGMSHSSSNEEMDDLKVIFSFANVQFPSNCVYSHVQ